MYSFLFIHIVHVSSYILVLVKLLWNICIYCGNKYCVYLLNNIFYIVEIYIVFLMFKVAGDEPSFLFIITLYMYHCMYRFLSNYCEIFVYRVCILCLINVWLFQVAGDEPAVRPPGCWRHPRQPNVHALRQGTHRAAVREGNV